MSAVIEEAPRPKIYDASEVAYKDSPRLQPPKVTTDPIDPLRSFETDDKQVATDLRLWATFPEADRAQRLVDMEIGYQKALAMAISASDPHQAVAVRESRWRAYSYIVWRESKPEILNSEGKVGPKGSKAVAAKAAELLFIPLRPPEKK